MSFRCRIVLSAANHYSLPNSVVCSEWVFGAKLCCRQQISVHCWIVLSEANQCSLPNCVVCSKSGALLNSSTSSRTVSAAELWCPSESVRWWVYVATNQLANESVLQRISSLRSLCFNESVCWRVMLQWISSLMNLCFGKSISLTSPCDQFCW
jgi:hypothetical protein